MVIFNLGQKETRDLVTRPAARSRTFLADPLLCSLTAKGEKKEIVRKGRSEGGERRGIIL